MEFKSCLISFDETTLLTFVTETKNGELDIIETISSQLSRIEARREEPTEPTYYYSFQ